MDTDLIKIKKGNSFPLIVHLKDNQDNVIDRESVADLELSLYSQYSPKTVMEYSIQDNSIIIHVTPAVASVPGKYRLIITGTYSGNAIDRGLCV
jgi:hypothetical protein